jgi:SRSO17 transposase
VWTNEDRVVAAAASVDVDRWQTELAEVVARVGHRFHRHEPRAHAAAVVSALMAGVEDPNCWTLAEQVGHAGPDAIQHLLARARWDEDGVRDDLRDYVAEHLSAQVETADPVGTVLVADETGDLKKGRHTVGVHRQYTGTAGRIENAQVAVYLLYATSVGHAFIDRELYLPKAWTDDPARCAAAGVPDDVAFATKPALAGRMLARTLDAGIRVRWFAGDEVYGQDPALRRQLRAAGVGYVVAIASDHRLTTGIGTRRAVDLAVRPDLPWHRLSAGDGAHGHRWYDWALIDLHPADRDHDAHGGHHALLIRRNRTTGELAFYRTWTPAPVTLATLVTVAGRRWTIEEAFQSSKGLTGLDDHQVRRWTSWRRWTVLAMFAHAILTVLTATATSLPTRDDTNRNDLGDHNDRPALIPPTRNEIQRLIAAMTATVRGHLDHALAWSYRRRRTQARARASHYKRQAITTQ